MPKPSRTRKTHPPFVSFLVAREYRGKNGEWNPRFSKTPLRGGFQINVMGTRRHYLRLAQFIRRFAQRTTSKDSEHHEHFMGLMSANGEVRLHIILRKDDVGTSTWRAYFPNDT